ncbi:MAG: KH domain-containing protein [Candidatus Diapherotrites archaeon]|nr:KH domain-containing protein [Candidatus Diapherotrites archaeon]
MDEILLINALARVANVNAKDCLVGDHIVSYLVKGSEVGKAIGKKAINVKELEKKLNKRIEIIGFETKPEEVIKKTFEIELGEVKQKKGRLIIGLDNTNKKKVLSNSSRLRRVKELMKRNYDLEVILK